MFTWKDFKCIKCVATIVPLFKQTNRMRDLSVNETNVHIQNTMSTRVCKDVCKNVCKICVKMCVKMYVKMLDHVK